MKPNGEEKDSNCSLDVSSKSSNQIKIDEDDTKTISQENQSNQITTSESLLSDQIRLHNKLEIIEHRIHFDIDQVHGHPCQCINALDENPNVTLTEEDEELRWSLSNYKIKNPVQIIPQFWPSRVYDDDSAFKIQKLNEKQTERLRNQIIEEQNQIGKYQIKHNMKPNLQKGNVRRTFQRPLFTSRRKTYDSYLGIQKRNEKYSGFFLRLPARLYDTDDSIDETDGEFF